MSDRPAAARRTSQRVHLVDRFAEHVISLGGIAVLAAVLGIAVYLLYVVLPLFRGGDVTAAGEGRLNAERRPALAFVDEYGRAGATLSPDGVVRYFLIDGGAVLGERPVGEPGGPALQAWAAAPGGRVVALAFDDDTYAIGEIGFESRLLGEAAIERLAEGLPAELAARVEGLAAGGVVALQAGGEDYSPPDLPGAFLSALAGEAEGQVDIRLTGPSIELSRPDRLRDGEGAVERLTIAESPAGAHYIGVVRADGTAMVGTVVTRASLGGGPPRTRTSWRPVEMEVPERGLPEHFFVTGDGDHALALWQDGHLRRYSRSAGDGDTLALAETLEATGGEAVTQAAMLTGSLTLMLGDAGGDVANYLLARRPAADTADGFATVEARRFAIGDSPVRAFASSARDRLFAAGLEGGAIGIRHATSRKDVATIDAGSTPAVLAVAPKSDGLLALAADGSYGFWRLDPGYAGVSFSSLFGRVHYEGMDEPEYVYQSSAASDTAELKMSLVPLIFGTIKATIFAMLFAVPIAVGGAIYTSEFLHPRARRVIKPGIELMATLPSVVLGFIAAMVVAPYVRDWLTPLLLSFALAPLTVVLAATLWHVLPQRISRRLRGIRQMAAVALVLALAAVLSVQLARPIERALFSPSERDVLILAGEVEPLPPEQWPEWVGQRRDVGPELERRLRRQGLSFAGGSVVRPREPADPEAFAARVERGGLDEPGLRRWLDGAIGGATPGWFMVLLLPAVVAAWVARAALLDRRLNDLVRRLPHVRSAAIELARLLATLVGGALLAWAAAALLGSLGLDPRDSILGRYTQRNTMVVAIVMGVAIIPIIYTISEDAMRSVPHSLRLGSLGAGATPWQTATRIVLPVAGSGVFSACMIGLGRAVGETMIVLMATGSTPEMNWNVFSGFRTLSANIAMELPEAPKGGEHYRVLFLCGLVLFVMTFAINTSAELVRQHFRRRNAAL